ncbi:hypothetical protein [Bartonella apis]|uniref:hypothetical protein n=1 Tax=Bartonella apis TaxID=1686310 RepID=UPI00242D1C5D|nr:hypothetical protein [Bartonella apis]
MEKLPGVDSNFINKAVRIINKAVKSSIATSHEQNGGESCFYCTISFLFVETPNLEYQAKNPAPSPPLVFSFFASLASLYHPNGKGKRSAKLPSHSGVMRLSSVYYQTAVCFYSEQKFGLRQES